MERYDCGGDMTIRPYLETRTLVITVAHSYHNPYVNIGLDETALQFIAARIAESTPSQIYRDLMASSVPGCASVAQHQVYYQWQQGNASSWRRDADQFQSANMLLEEPFAADKCDHAILTSGNLRGLALFVRESMSSLHRNVRELAMDATFGTNHAGMDLFAVLAELDGTGVVLAYCFVGVSPSHDGPRRADAGALTCVLEQFLQRIRMAGFNPSFFGTDKDTSEIAAVKLVWPEATLQLCYWHAKRSIRTKLKDSSRSRTQAHYSPEDAMKLIPELEICWGSLPTRRPNGDHRYGRCQCISRTETFEEHGRIEQMSMEQKETVIRMFCRHFNYHPLIPDRNGTFRSPNEIHQDCASEVYWWCRGRGFFRLWAYLFINWYRPGQWELWARSANAVEIPVLKTTMVVESHWRRIKHDFLHRFNRPRVDLVVWILVTRVIPDAITRMRAITSSNHRLARAAWRKGFKTQWKSLQGKIINPDSIRRYHTDPIKWICACEAFLESRFFICKHLLQCLAPFDRPMDFFRSVQRRRTWPFLDHSQLVVLPEFQVSGVAGQDQGPDVELESGTESEASEDSEIEMPSQGGSTQHFEDQSDDEQNSGPDVKGFFSTMRSALEIAEEQHEKGNTAFVDRFIASNVPNLTLVEEVDRKRNRRTINPTWGRYRHPATMYYN